MQDRFVGQMAPGKDVCDTDGVKIGTVARTYRLDPLRQPIAGAEPSGLQEYMEVKTGLFGLGKHYYVPLDAVETVAEEEVVLARRRDDLAQEGWDRRPASLDQLT